ncbi:MAG TPA: CPBP family intramembrane glutamic endopeptidase [Gemmata sp.]|nr:CPBP family intramembrane glutamic endopeptidase [Gemmata sp.]
MGRVFFALQACVTGPLIEEILFRGGILPWVIGASAARPGAPPQVLPRSLRPWLVVGIAVVFAAETQRPGPVIFAGSLAAGLAILWLVVRRGGRNVRGVFATSALFAAVHSSVWPSPVPLFPLAIGLGYVAVRTHGVFVPFLVHGLFNAVSVVYVLRGGAG